MEKRAKSLETILVLTAALLAFSLWMDKNWLLWAALALALAGIFWPRGAEKIHAGWMRLARVLGWLNGRILLTLLFFLLLTPLAWLARALGAGADFQLRRRQSGSYFTERDHVFEPKDLEDMW